MEAARNNLEKAKAALAAAFVGGRAFARSFCRFRRAGPLFAFIANPLVVRAEQLFERAGVTKTINAVSILPRNTKAVPGDVITKDLALKTGGDYAPSWSSPTSRLPVLVPMRSSALSQVNAKSSSTAGRCSFTVSAAERLNRRDHCGGDGHGLSDFKHKEGQGDLSRRKGARFFHGKTQGTQGAEARADRRCRGRRDGMPPSVTINLTTLLATSMLGEAGGLGPFPNQAAIEKNARNQQDASLLGGFLPGPNNC